MAGPPKWPVDYTSPKRLGFCAAFHLPHTIWIEPSNFASHPNACKQLSKCLPTSTLGRSPPPPAKANANLILSVPCQEPFRGSSKFEGCNRMLLTACEALPVWPLLAYLPEFTLSLILLTSPGPALCLGKAPPCVPLPQPSLVVSPIRQRFLPSCLSAQPNPAHPLGFTFSGKPSLTPALSEGLPISLLQSI